MSTTHICTAVAAMLVTALVVVFVQVVFQAVHDAMLDRWSVEDAVRLAKKQLHKKCNGTCYAVLVEEVRVGPELDWYLLMSYRTGIYVDKLRIGGEPRTDVAFHVYPSYFGLRAEYVVWDVVMQNLRK